MISFAAHIYLTIATIVWAVWRVALWRVRPRDPIRELAIAALFLWSLAVLGLTFFPLNIVLYDWRGSVNLIPLASIYQLVTETNPSVARYNVVGNLLLFVPFGVLLPLTFAQLRSLGPLLWRCAAISASIELGQLLTQARATDIDDVILNTIGAAIGYGLFTVARRALISSDATKAVLDRMGASAAIEPLFAGLVPTAATAVIALPLMLSAVLGATMGGGADGILGFAVEGRPTGEVAASTEANGHSFVVVTEGAERMALYTFEEVVPGRFTWIGTSEAPSGGERSRYTWTIGAFNPEYEAGPVVAVWGTNHAGAGTIVITGNGAAERFALPENDGFVTAFLLELDPETLAADAFEDFRVDFLDPNGNDVSHLFDMVER